MTLIAPILKLELIGRGETQFFLKDTPIVSVLKPAGHVPFFSRVKNTAEYHRKKKNKGRKKEGNRLEIKKKQNKKNNGKRACFS